MNTWMISKAVRVNSIETSERRRDSIDSDEPYSQLNAFLPLQLSSLSRVQVMNSLLSFLPSSDSRRHWACLGVLCLALEAVALFYQYQLEYLPCVLCIHVRMLLAVMLIIAIAALIKPPKGIGGKIVMLMMVLLWFWMLERSWQLLGVEMGFIMGACDMNSGLPAWMPFERWLPWLFKIHEPCGYTPYLVGKISMAEVLLALSTFMSVIYGLAFLLRLRPVADAS